MTYQARVHKRQNLQRLKKKKKKQNFMKFQVDFKNLSLFKFLATFLNLSKFSLNFKAKFKLNSTPKFSPFGCA